MAIREYVITTAGAALLNQAMSSGNLIFTRGAIGSGALSAGSDLKARTGMIASVSNMTISSATVSGGKTRVICQFTNVNGQGGYLPAFRWNETGLFAKIGASGAETLLAYANTRDAQAGDLVPETACEFEIAFEVEFSGAESASFSSSGLIFATLTQLGTKANLSHMHTAGEVTAGTLAGGVKANATSAAALTTRQLRNIVVSTTAPTDCANGDIWLQYST